MDKTDLEKDLIRASVLSECIGIDNCIITVLKLKKDYLESIQSVSDYSEARTAIVITYDLVLQKLEELKNSCEQK